MNAIFTTVKDSEEYKLVRLIEYHLITGSTLRDDIGSNDQGYKDNITQACINKYRAKDWQDAYDLAAKYHEQRYEELLKSLPGGEKTLSEIRNDEMIDWCFNHVQLGEEPKID